MLKSTSSADCTFPSFCKDILPLGLCTQILSEAFAPGQIGFVPIIVASERKGTLYISDIALHSVKSLIHLAHYNLAGAL